MEEFKNPCECFSINEIREQIDGIDAQLVRLFAKRTEFVKEITKYKSNNLTEIVAEDRKKHVIKQRSEWAEQHGLDKNIYAKLFELLIDHNIAIEFETIRMKQEILLQDV